VFISVMMIICGLSLYAWSVQEKRNREQRARRAEEQRRLAHDQALRGRWN